MKPVAFLAVLLVLAATIATIALNRAFEPSALALPAAHDTPTPDSPAGFLPAPNPTPMCDSVEYFDYWSLNKAVYSPGGLPSQSVDTDTTSTESGPGGIKATFTTLRQATFTQGGVFTPMVGTGGLRSIGIVMNGDTGTPGSVSAKARVNLSEPLFYSQWVFTDMDQPAEGFNVTPAWRSTSRSLSIFSGDADFDFTGTTNGNAYFADATSGSLNGNDLAGRAQVDFYGAIAGFDVERSGQGGSGFAIGGGCPPIGISKVASTPVWNANGTVTVDYKLAVVNNLPSQATLDAKVAAARANAANYFATGTPVAIDQKNLQITDKLELTGFSVAKVSNLQAQGDLTVNPNFDGSVDTNVLTGTDTLPADTQESLSFRVTYTPDYSQPQWKSCQLTLTNQARASANADSIKVDDLSDNGANPAPAEVNEAGTGTDDATPITFTRRCDVGLAKMITAGPTSNGDGTYDLDYTFNVTNYSQVPVSDPVIADDLSGAFGSAFLSSDPPTVDTCTGVTLQPGGKCKVVLPVTIKPTNSLGPWENSAKLTATGPGGGKLTDISDDGDDPDPEVDGPGNNSTPTPLSMTPSIGLAKSVISRPVSNGDGTYDVGYKFIVENTGDVYITDPVIDDDLNAAYPAGVVSRNVTKDTCTGTALDLGDTCEVELVARVKTGNSTGPFNNSATVTGKVPGGKVTDISDNGTETDPGGDGPGNDSDPTPVNLNQGPEIGLAKAITGTPVDNGDGTYDVTYVLVATNTGDVRLNNPVIDDDLSDTFGAKLVGSKITADTCKNAVLNASPADGNGQRCSVTIVATVLPGRDLGPYRNSATVEAVSDAGKKVTDISDDTTEVVDANKDGVPDDTNGDGIPDFNDPDGNGDDDPSNDSDPTPVSFPDAPQIGVAKGAYNLKDLPNGRFSVKYLITATNTGLVPLTNVTLVENLAKTFGAVPFTVTDVTATDAANSAQINDGYTGAAGTDGVIDSDDLLDGSGSLGAGESIQLIVTVEFTPGGNHGPFDNTAVATGTSPGGQKVTDVSNDSPFIDINNDGVPDDRDRDGIPDTEDPDPDGDGDPTNNDVPTRVLVPSIGVTKSVVSVVNNREGTYDVTYEVSVSNTGPVDVYRLQLTEDLADTFAGTRSWSILSVTSNDLTVNPSFNGDTNVDLLSGTNRLRVGEVSLLRFKVRLVPGDDLGPFNNTVTATGVGAQVRTPNGNLVDGPAVRDDSQNTAVGDNNSDPDVDGDPTNNNDPTPVALDEKPLIGLSKEVVGSPVRQSDGSYRIDFKLVAKNMGDVRLSDVSVVDDMAATFKDASVTVKSIAATAPGVPNRGYDGKTDIEMLTNTRLEVGESTTITVTVIVKPGTELSFLNQAVATGTSPAGRNVTDKSQDGGIDPNNNGDPTDNDDPTPIKVPPVAPTTTAAPEYDLALIKLEESSGPYTKGDRLTYEIVVANQGQIPANSYQITDTLAAGTSLVPGQVWVANGNKITLDVNTPLLPGQTRNFLVTVSLDDDTLGTYVNSAGISRDDGDDSDSTPSTDPGDPTIDRTQPSDLNIDNQTGDEDDSDIAVIKIDPQVTTTTTTVAPTTTTTYPDGGTTTSTNPSGGTTTSTNPSGGTTTSRNPSGGTTTSTNPNGGTTTSTNPNGGTTTSTNPNGGTTTSTNPSGGTTTTTKPSGTTTTVVNSTTSTSNPGGGTTTTSAPTTTTTKPSSTKASLGDYVWVDINKNGIQDAGEPGLVGIAAILRDKDGKEVARTVTDANGKYIFTDLEPGEYSVDFLVPEDKGLSPAGAGNDSTKDSDGRVSGTVTVDGKTYTVVSTNKVTLVAGDAERDIDLGVLPDADDVDLVLTKKVVVPDPKTREALWTITVVNSGPGTDKGPIVVTDQLPASLQFVSASGDEVSCEQNGQTVVCTYDADLLAGESIKIDIKTTVKADAGAKVSNNATVAGGSDEITLTNNDDTADLPGGDDLVDLVLEKSFKASGGPGTVDWNLQVTNTGADDNGEITVTDSLPGTLTYTGSSGDGWTCSAQGPKVTCSLEGGLGAGETSTVVLSTKVNAPGGSLVSNTATVSSTSKEKTLVNNTDTADVEIAAPPSDPNPVAFTGANSLRLASASLLFLVAGIALIVVRRREAK